MIEVFDLRLKRRGFFYGYNNSINPMAASSFGTAAFRFGHSLIPKNLNRCNRFHQLLPYSKLHQKMNFWFIVNIKLNLFKKRNTFEEGIDGSHSYPQHWRCRSYFVGHVLSTGNETRRVHCRRIDQPSVPD